MTGAIWSDGAVQLTLTSSALAALIYLVKQLVGGVLTLLSFFRRIDKALTNVETQLYPNGGSSLRDAVNKIQASLGIVNHPSEVQEDIHKASTNPGRTPKERRPK